MKARLVSAAFLAGAACASAAGVSPTLAWAFKTGGAVTSPAVDSAGIIYVGSADGQLRAIHPNGTLLWNHTVGGSIASSPALSPNEATVVFGCDGEPDIRCCRLLTDNG